MRVLKSDYRRAPGECRGTQRTGILAIKGLNPVVISDSRDIRVLPPFPVDSLTTDGPLAKTYLDVRGRPTIVLEKRDCSDRCGQDVLVSLLRATCTYLSEIPPLTSERARARAQIEYSLPLSVDLLQKPLAIAALGFVLFVVLSFARRSDWSIPSGGSAAVVGKGEKAL